MIDKYLKDLRNRNRFKKILSMAQLGSQTAYDSIVHNYVNYLEEYDSLKTDQECLSYEHQFYPEDKIKKIYNDAKDMHPLGIFLKALSKESKFYNEQLFNDTLNDFIFTPRMYPFFARDLIINDVISDQELVNVTKQIRSFIFETFHTENLIDHIISRRNTYRRIYKIDHPNKKNKYFELHGRGTFANKIKNYLFAIVCGNFELKDNYWSLKPHQDPIFFKPLNHVYGFFKNLNRLSEYQKNIEIEDLPFTLKDRFNEFFEEIDYPDNFFQNDNLYNDDLFFKIGYFSKDHPIKEMRDLAQVQLRLNHLNDFQTMIEEPSDDIQLTFEGKHFISSTIAIGIVLNDFFNKFGFNSLGFETEPILKENKNLNSFVESFIFTAGLKRDEILLKLPDLDVFVKKYLKIYAQPVEEIIPYENFDEVEL